MEHVTTELPDLLLNALSDPDRKRIERHLEECPACRDEWDTLSSLRALLPLRAPLPARQPKAHDLSRSDIKLRKHEGGREPLYKRDPVPQGYFSTLPARILERRNSGVGRQHVGWFRPAFQNILVPLAAGVLVIIALSTVSFDTAPEKVADLPVSSDDAVEYVLENDVISDLVPATTPLDYMSDASLADHGSIGVLTPGLEDLELQSTQDMVAGLSDAEVERLIVRLNERAIL